MPDAIYSLGDLTVTVLCGLAIFGAGVAASRLVPTRWRQTVELVLVFGWALALTWSSLSGLGVPRYAPEHPPRWGESEQFGPAMTNQMPPFGRSGHARGLLEAHFDELFMHDATGYRPHWPDTVRELLITWEPRH